MSKNLLHAIANALSIGSLFLLLVSPHNSWEFGLERDFLLSDGAAIMPLIFFSLLIGSLIASSFKQRPLTIGPILLQSFILILSCGAATVFEVVAPGLHGVNTQQKLLYNPNYTPALIAVSAFMSGFLLRNAHCNKLQATFDSTPRHQFSILPFFTILSVCTGWTLCATSFWAPLSPLDELPPMLLIALGTATAFGIGYWLIFLRPCSREILLSILGVISSFSLLEALDSYSFFSIPERLAPFLIALAAISTARIVAALRMNAKAPNIVREKTHEQQFSDSTLCRELPFWEKLSKNERRSLERALAGKTSTQIAQELEVAPSTIRSYLQRSYKKLQVSSLKELISCLRNSAAEPSGSSSSTSDADCPCSAPAFNNRTALISLIGSSILFFLLFLSPLTSSILPTEITLLGLSIGILSIALFPQGHHVELRPFCILSIAIQAALGSYLVVRAGIWQLDHTLPTPLFDSVLCLGGAAALGRQLSEFAAILAASLSTIQHEKRMKLVTIGLTTSSVLYLLTTLLPQLLLAVIGPAFAYITILRLRSVRRRALDTPRTPDPLSSTVDPIRSLATIQGTLSAFLWLSLGLTQIEQWTSFASFLIPMVPIFFLIVVLASFSLISARFHDKWSSLQTLVPLLLSMVAGLFISLRMPYASISGLLCEPVACAVIFACTMADSRLFKDYAIPSLPVWLPFGLFAGSLLSFFNSTASQVAQLHPNVEPIEIARSLSIYSNYLCIFYALGIVSVGALFHLERHSALEGETKSLRASERIASYLLSQGFSPCQCEVLALIYEGKGALEISAQLSYSIGTINSTRFAAYRSLGIHSRKQLKDLIDSRVFQGKSPDDI